jgi:hypothetical protein
MTDESQGPDPTEPTPPPPSGLPADEHDEAKVLAGAGDFTSGEGLVAFAGIVLLGVWLIFSVIAAEYGIDWLILLLAVGAVILPRLDRQAVDSVAPLPVLMKVIGYALVITGVFNLVADLRFGVLDDAWDILGGLATYAAGVMAFLGARQIKT